MKSILQLRHLTPKSPAEILDDCRRFEVIADEREPKVWNELLKDRKLADDARGPVLLGRMIQRISECHLPLLQSLRSKADTQVKTEL